MNIKSKSNRDQKTKYATAAFSVFAPLRRMDAGFGGGALM
ncbi:hypothetical protein LT85_4174 [Collimonas arenae]|uniref:Uncharacterized protein n=1 Tax=Collimonas arenae TaxID=279058 RepID=A0A0A1FKC4_9BURK|nr:hypothetical protein LT85_4174 [Collimonas arenae]